MRYNSLALRTVGGTRAPQLLAKWLLCHGRVDQVHPLGAGDFQLAGSEGDYPGPSVRATGGQRRQNFPETKSTKEGFLEEVVFDSWLSTRKERGEGRARRTVSRPGEREVGRKRSEVRQEGA